MKKLLELIQNKQEDLHKGKPVHSLDRCIQDWFKTKPERPTCNRKDQGGQYEANRPI